MKSHNPLSQWSLESTNTGTITKTARVKIIDAILEIVVRWTKTVFVLRIVNGSENSGFM